MLRTPKEIEFSSIFQIRAALALYVMISEINIESKPSILSLKSGDWYLGKLEIASASIFVANFKNFSRLVSFLYAQFSFQFHFSF